jgi:ribosomal protein L7Ae-like RNA K-turn-binding protein
MKEIEAKMLSYLGLAARAGQVTVGVTLVCEALKRRAASSKKEQAVVLFSADASPATKKRILDRTAYYGVPAAALSLDGEALATAVGKRGASVAAVLVSEAHLAAEIVALHRNASAT